MVLEEALEKAKSEMISASLALGEQRARYWMERVSKAELEDAEQPMLYGESRFFAGIPRNPKIGWARLTLLQPIGEGRAQDVAEQYGVLLEFEDDLHLVVYGEPSLVRKALADFHYLSQPSITPDEMDRGQQSQEIERNNASIETKSPGI